MADAGPRRKKDRLREVTRQHDEVQRQIAGKRARLSELMERVRESPPAERAPREALLGKVTALNEAIEALVAERDALTARAAAIRQEGRAQRKAGARKKPGKYHNVKGKAIYKSDAPTAVRGGLPGLGKRR